MSYFNELQAFVAVVDRGSFSKAAEQLGLVKSAISKKVTDLESRLGVKLLNRTTRRLNLTDTGKDYYERAKQILHDLAEAEAAVSSDNAALQGSLKIAAPLSFGLRHLMPAINEFMAENTALKLDVDLNDRQINVVEEGFDVAIRIGRLPDSTLMARRLATLHAHLCASPAYLAIWGEPEKPEDLLQHQALLYSNMGKNWHFMDKAGKKHTVQVPIRLKTNNGDSLMSAAEAGLGLVLSPDFIAYDAIKEKRLKVIMPDYVLESFDVYAVYPQTRYLSHRVRVLIDFLAERFADEACWQAYD